MTGQIGKLRILAGGVAIVEEGEDLVVEGEGTGLTLRWNRDDDNVLTGGTVDSLTADLPRARPDIDVVHVFSIGTAGDERLVEVRFLVEWVHGLSKRVTYTLLGNF